MARDIRVLLAILVLFLLLSALGFIKSGKFAGYNATMSQHEISAVPIPPVPPAVRDDGEIKPPEKDVFANGSFQAGQGLVPVLMYHHVGVLPPHPDKIRLDLTVSTADFSEQIALL